LALAQPNTAPERARIELLRARVARAQDDAELWYDAARTAARDLPAPGERVAAIALRAAAARRLGRDLEADGLFRDVAAAADVVPVGEAGFAVYLAGVDAWEARDFARAERFAKRNITARTQVGESQGLLGWIAVGRERFVEAGAHFAASLKAFDAQGEEADARMKARSLSGAAMMARDTVDLKLGRRVRHAYETMRWSDEQRKDRFSTLATVSFLWLLEGDVGKAWFAARDAAAMAPTPARSAFAEANAAAVSRLLGDDGAFRLQLARAWELLRAHRWGAADDEERLALTTFALEGASAMPAEARKVMTIYRSLKAKANVSHSLYQDRRVTAIETWAAARVSEVIGRRPLAIEQYRAALALFVELEHPLHSAAVALDLRRLIKGNAHQPYVKALLERAPRAWLGRELREQPALERISPAQREVLVRLLQGKSAKTIAGELGRSPYTVINHTRAAFSTFGVHSRDALRRRCDALGIKPETLRAGP